MSKNRIRVDKLVNRSHHVMDSIQWIFSNENLTSSCNDSYYDNGAFWHIFRTKKAEVQIQRATNLRANKPVRVECDTQLITHDGIFEHLVKNSNKLVVGRNDNYDGSNKKNTTTYHQPNTSNIVVKKYGKIVKLHPIQNNVEVVVGKWLAASSSWQKYRSEYNE